MIFALKQQDHIQPDDHVSHELGEQSEYRLLRNFDPTPVWVGEVPRHDYGDQLNREKNAQREHRNNQHIPPAPHGIFASFSRR